MINPGYSWDQMNDFHALLRQPHGVTTQVHQLDYSLARVIRDLSDRLLDGQVDIDANAAITRSVGLSLLDPDHSLGFDNVNGASGSIYYGKMIRVWQTYYDINNPARQYTFPLFTGPVTDVDRDGVVLQLTMQGKEILTDKGQFRAWTWPTGWAKWSVVQNAMQIFFGELYFAFQVAGINFGSYTLRQNWSVEPGDNLWTKLQELIGAMSHQLYYNTMGILCIRPLPNAHVAMLDDTWLTSIPDPSYSLDNLINAVRVNGGTPEGYEGRYVVEALPDPNFPLSPQALAINGVPRFMPEFVDDDTLVDGSDVIDRAYSLLYSRLNQAVDVSYTCAVFPHLEEEDRVLINTASYYGVTTFIKASIPLVGAATMSMGFMSTVSYAGSAGGGGRLVKKPKLTKKSKKLLKKKFGKKYNKLPEKKIKQFLAMKAKQAEKKAKQEKKNKNKGSKAQDKKKKKK